MSLKNDGHKRPLLEAQIKESLKKQLSKKAILSSKRWKKLKVQKCLKPPLRTLNESYERFNFWRAWNLMSIPKNTSVNHGKSKNHEKLKSSFEKIQKVEHQKKNSSRVP